MMQRVGTSPNVIDEVIRDLCRWYHQLAKAPYLFLSLIKSSLLVVIKWNLLCNQVCKEEVLINEKNFIGKVPPPFDSQTWVEVRNCIRVSHDIIPTCTASVFNPTVFPSNRKITIAPKKAPLRFKSLIRTRSQTRMENQEVHQATVSFVEVNETKSELRNLTNLMSVMISWFENQSPPPTAQDSGSSRCLIKWNPQCQTQSMHILLSKLIFHNPISSIWPPEVPR